jgi:predicted RNA-binding Zn ribbon-like protein
MEIRELQLSLKPHVILERGSDSDDVVLIDSQSGRMNACNETASVIVSQLEAGSTLRRLVDTLMRRFAVTDAVAVRDVNAFLDMLAGEGLLETTARSASARRARTA